MKNSVHIVSATALAALFSFHVQAESTRAFLSADNALKGIQACQTLAKEKNWNMAVVIVDRGEDVRASFRMDEALPGAYLGASLKAKTALSWSMPTAKVGDFVKTKPEFNQYPGLLTIGGGLPVFSESGSLIGGVGVAGGYVEHDEACALAVVTAIQSKD